MIEINFFTLLSVINGHDNQRAEAVRDTIETRLWWMDAREPESDGIKHENWEEKYDALSEILDKAEELMEIINTDKAEELAKELQNDIYDFQEEYGGLSRLKSYLLPEK
jgi:protein subunit release factor A